MTKTRTFVGNTPLILAKQMVAYSRKYWGMYKYQKNHGWLQGVKDSDTFVLPFNYDEISEIKCTLPEFINNLI